MISENLQVTIYHCPDFDKDDLQYNTTLIFKSLLENVY